MQLFFAWLIIMSTGWSRLCNNKPNSYNKVQNNVCFKMVQGNIYDLFAQTTWSWRETGDLPGAVGMWGRSEEHHIRACKKLKSQSEWLSESRSVMSDSLRSCDYTVHGILQARLLEWVAFPFSRGSFWPRDQTHVTWARVRLYYKIKMNNRMR